MVTEMTVKQIGFCNRCGRRLSDPESVRANYGPNCLRKVKCDCERESDSPDAAPKLPFSTDTMDVACRRTPNGTAFNIPHTIVRHSPTGMEWGYGGSGPSDFALNVLFRFTGDEDFSWHYHQDFKRDFICGLPDEGGTIPGNAIAAWIQERRAIPHSQLTLPGGG